MGKIFSNGASASKHWKLGNIISEKQLDDVTIRVGLYLEKVKNTTDLSQMALFEDWEWQMLAVPVNFKKRLLENITSSKS